MYYTKSDVAGCNVRHLYVDTSIIIIIIIIIETAHNDRFILCLTIQHSTKKIERKFLATNLLEFVNSCSLPMFV